MRTCYVWAVVLNLLALVVGLEQAPLNSDGKGHGERLVNITLDFDDLPTDPKTGIGFSPRKGKAQKAFRYKDLYLESFELVNPFVGGSKPGDPACATSPDNSIFVSRPAGHPYPRITLHDLTKDAGHEDIGVNATFGLVTMNLAPRGRIARSSLVLANFKLLKLTNEKGTRPAVPEDGIQPIFQGSPMSQITRFVMQLAILYPPGLHHSREFPFRQILGPGFGNYFNVLEIYGELLEYNSTIFQYESKGDFPLCLDDIVLEVDKLGREPPVPQAATSRMLMLEDGNENDLGSLDDIIAQLPEHLRSEYSGENFKNEL